MVEFGNCPNWMWTGNCPNWMWIGNCPNWMWAENCPHSNSTGDYPHWMKTENSHRQPGHFPYDQLRSGHFRHCSVTAVSARPITARALRSSRGSDCPGCPAAWTTESRYRHWWRPLRPPPRAHSHGSLRPRSRSLFSLHRLLEKKKEKGPEWGVRHFLRRKAQ